MGALSSPRQCLLNQVIQLDRSNFASERAFKTLRNVFLSKIPQCLKMEVYIQCVLPALKRGLLLWASYGTSRLHRVLWRGQNMRRFVNEIRCDSPTDKWQWPEHIARRADGQWGKRFSIASRIPASAACDVHPQGECKPLPTSTFKSMSCGWKCKPKEIMKKK